VAVSAGFARILPGSPYYPPDHHFDWEQGRVLQAYQIILITEGKGIFESASTPGILPVEAGTVLLLFPGIWHRYRPAPETGWVAHWIECRGSAFDEALSAGLIKPERSVLRVGSAPELRDCFERCHALAHSRALANQDLLATVGLQMLALLGHLSLGEGNYQKAIDEVIERAHSLIALRCQQPLKLQDLAVELGVSYSHFRHSFSARLGCSPKQYYLDARLRKTQDLLLNTVKSIKEIAEALGFESAFHLSKQFKAHYGISPRAWRAGRKNPQPRAEQNQSRPEDLAPPRPDRTETAGADSTLSA
jgi:AraC-like DNA-binding protein